MKNGKAANARYIGPMTEAVAQELRAELARQKRSAKNLAESAGLTRSTLHKTLNAQRAIDVDDLFHLADLLNISPTEIFQRAEDVARAALDDGLDHWERTGADPRDVGPLDEDHADLGRKQDYDRVAREREADRGEEPDELHP